MWLKVSLVAPAATPCTSIQLQLSFRKTKLPQYKLAFPWVFGNLTFGWMWVPRAGSVAETTDPHPHDESVRKGFVISL